MDSPNVSQPRPVLIFIHIPKAGGTTLRGLFSRLYPSAHSLRLIPQRLGKNGAYLEDFIASPPDFRDQCVFLNGHLGFGLHRYLSRPVDYFTVLRHPISRFVSNFFHEFRGFHARNGLQEDGSDQLSYLEEFVFTDEGVDNAQTRMLAATDGRVDRRSPCTPAMLERAKENLLQSFPVFGILERFDESILMLYEFLGSRRFPFYLKKNRNPYRVDRHHIPTVVLDRIAEMHRFDLPLYEFARTEFERRVDARGPAFVRRAERFRRLNRVYETLGGWTTSAREAAGRVLRGLR